MAKRVIRQYKEDKKEISFLFQARPIQANAKINYSGWLIGFYCHIILWHKKSNIACTGGDDKAACLVSNKSHTMYPLGSGKTISRLILKRGFNSSVNKKKMYSL